MEENTSKQKSHPSTQSTQLGSLMVFELHPWLMSQICHLQLRKGKKLCCDLHAVICPSHKPHWFQTPWPWLPAPGTPCQAGLCCPWLGTRAKPLGRFGTGTALSPIPSQDRDNNSPPAKPCWFRTKTHLKSAASPLTHLLNAHNFSSTSVCRH